ncbi:hypothetical protein C8Q74DRAFT_1445192, partial [Fomes fomentarius]
MAWNIPRRARPLPLNAPDSRYDTEILPVSADTNNDDPHSNLYKVVSNIGDSTNLSVDYFLQKVANPKTFKPRIDAVTNKEALGDRKGLAEGFKESKLFNDVVTTLLYNTLPHPPDTYIGADFPDRTHSAPAPPQNAGPRLRYTVGNAHGSGNNMNLPALDKARTHGYARSVQNKSPLPQSSGTSRRSTPRSGPPTRGARVGSGAHRSSG